VRTRTITLSVSLIALTIFVTPAPRLSSGQEQKKLYGAILCCDVPIYVSDEWTGTNRQKSCTDYLNNASPDERSRVCAQLKKGQAFSKVACLRDYSQYCPDAKPKSCVETTNDDPTWFDPSNPGCQDKQETRVATSWTNSNGGTCLLTVTGCNKVLITQQVNIVERIDGRIVDTLSAPGMTPEELAARGLGPVTRSECNNGLYRSLHRHFPGTVCCDLWNEAVAAGSGCNPEQDADCDGLPNDKDEAVSFIPYATPELPQGLNGDQLTVPNIDPRPIGLELDELMPTEQCKFCKWVLASGKLTCSPDGKRDHEYRATWLCPLTGMQRVVTKRAPPTAPCTPPSRA
jgi:hypothetical protein